MMPTNILIQQLPNLLAADPDSLNPGAGDENTVCLVASDFVEDPATVIGDVTLASFDGSTPKATGAGIPPVSTDPLTKEWLITQKEPAGGFRWQVSGVTDLPQTIYGYVLTNEDQTILLGMTRFDEPITVTQVGDSIDIGSAMMRFVPVPMS